MPASQTEIDEIEEYTCVDTIIANEKITTIEELLLKIKKYENLRYKCRREHDFLIRVVKSSEDVEIQFRLLWEDIVLENYIITDFVSDSALLSILYSRISEQANCRELRLLNKPEIGLKTFEFKIDSYVTLNFAEDFFLANPEYNEFFDTIYHNSEEDFIYRSGIPIYKDTEISDGVGQKVYK